MLKLSSLLSSAILLSAFSFSPILSAQTIEQGTLDAPIAFDGGIMDSFSGGLDPNLWEDTSASLAISLIQKAPLKSADPLIKDMLQAVLLSSGVPPQGNLDDQDSYDQTKLLAVSEIADLKTLDILVTRLGPAARTPIMQAELALRRNDLQTACGLSDTITEGRADVFWSRLRTVCHLEREEFAAAELTTDLLRSSDYQNAEYFSLISVLSGTSKKMPRAKNDIDVINVLLSKKAAIKLDMARSEQALDPQADADLRLASMFAYFEQLTDVEIARVLSELAFSAEELAGSASFDIVSAEENKTPQGVGQLFLLARATGNPEDAAKAFALLLERTPDQMVKDRFVSILNENIRNWPASVKVGDNLGLFANAAIDQEDIITLQNIFAALPDGPKQTRIALAADALGNGFLLGRLGSDIDGRLKTEDNQRALRDTLLALALGAQISEAALEVLPGAMLNDGRKLSAGDKAVLKSNADNRQIAQLILRLTPLLEGEKLASPDVAFVVEALMDAGLQGFAGRLAAKDFLEPL